MLPLRDHLPTRTLPFVNYGLILANVAVFFLQAQGVVGPEYRFVPLRIVVDPVAGIETAFTAMFMHAGLAHIGGNMLFLWIFGDNVEDAMGHARYVVFYLLGGICAAVAQGIASPTVPMIGASGAISAVLAAYAFLYPRSPVTVLNPVFILWLFFGPFLLLPAWLVIGLFFGVNLWDALSNTAQGGVAFMAHVGGFIGGALLLGPFMTGRDRMDDHPRWERWAEPRR